MVLITGGAGFIGSNLVHYWIEKMTEPVINVDKLTYAGNLQSLARIYGNPRHIFVRADIGDNQLVSNLLAKYKPLKVINLAAESHVDRSIQNPDTFVETNVLGTLRLLNAVYAYWCGLSQDAKAQFRFLHISTDEVYGSLGAGDPPFCETTRYAPNSPYAASKTAAEHFVRAAAHTFGVDVLITRTSNNYGPYQFPEKLLPLAISNALEDHSIPVYGDGMQVRDWVHVEDNCRALLAVLEGGRPGETYHIGGGGPLANIDVLKLLLKILAKPETLLTSVTDRLGHDRRYAVDFQKTTQELGWRPEISFEQGLRATVDWYRANAEWVRRCRSGEYRAYYENMYGEREATATKI